VDTLQKHLLRLPAICVVDVSLLTCKAVIKHKGTLSSEQIAEEISKLGFTSEYLPGVEYLVPHFTHLQILAQMP
jgi:hypothetical protein